MIVGKRHHFESDSIGVERKLMHLLLVRLPNEFSISIARNAANNEFLRSVFKFKNLVFPFTSGKRNRLVKGYEYLIK